MADAPEELAGRRIAALVLAGGKSSPEMQAASGGVPNRALVPLAGRPMLGYVVDAVRGGLDAVTSETARSRILVATAAEDTVPDDCVHVPDGASLIDTLLSGVKALRPDETRLLVATADIPFLSAGAVADFVRQGEATGAAFVYPIVPAGLCAARFPAMRRTTLRVREGIFTGGNLALLDPAFLRQNETLLRAAYARRKSVSGLAKLLGAPILLRLLAARLAPGLLAVAHLEAAVSDALGGVSARAVISSFPEVGVDVDRPADLAVAQAWAESRGEGV